MSLLAAWLFLAQRESRMRVFFAGSEVGESRLTRLPDDRFEAFSRFKIGPTAVDSRLEGTLRAGRVARYKADVTQGAVRLRIEYDQGAFLARRGDGDPVKVVETLPNLYGASLHPQLLAPFLRSPERLKTKTLFMLDVGSAVPVTVRDLPERTLRVGNRDRKIHRFLLAYGPTEIEYDQEDGGEVVAMDVPAQQLRFVVPGWEGLFDDPSAKYPELSQPTFRVERRKRLSMRTRDGVLLIGDVALPVGGGKFPVIVERTPYGREIAMALADYWAARGYAYVAQDCRGRGDSEGEWDPFVHEGEDGYDAIEWIARQPWCDGNVGTIGGSYAGTVQWQAAVERPPALRCIVPQVPAADAMRNLPYEYGAFDLFDSLWWARIVAGKRADLSQAARPLPNPKGLLTLPVGEIDRSTLGSPNVVFQKWVRRTKLGDWKGFDHLERLAESSVPALHVSGWYDGDGIGTKLDWEAMRRIGRQDQWLVYGPWTHAFNTSTRLDDLDFGPMARYDLDSLTLRFFDTFLKKKPVKMEDEPRVRAFVTGANRWVPLDGWPASNSSFQTLYLAPGELVSNPGRAGASVYIYDPAKDTNLTLARPSRISLPREGTYAFYKGKPVERPTALAGPFEVRLFFKSDAKDTDLFVSLIDLAPDGTMRPIGQPGKLRAAYRDSLHEPKPLVPGRTYAALLRPWDAAYELARGHRLALLVRSSLFPHFARNLGTGEPLATGRRMVRQRNVIFSGTAAPSRITFRKLW